MARRKTPFSGKAKKQQLQAKKLARKNDDTDVYSVSDDDDASTSQQSTKANKVSSKKKIPESQAMSNSQKYALKFRKETDAEMKENQNKARQEIQIPDSDIFFSEPNVKDCYPNDISFPRRPQWDYSISVDQLNKRENNYFDSYLENLEQQYNTKLGCYEQNLETWRQFWRVTEMADIVFYIVDIRFANVAFPPSIYEYFKTEMKKPLVLVFNKVDLVPEEVTLAWLNSMKLLYPDMPVVLFTSLPEYSLKNPQAKGMKAKKRKGKLQMPSEAALSVHKICQNIVGEQIDLSDWKEKIEQFLKTAEIKEELSIVNEPKSTEFEQYEKFKNDIITIGCIGQPNSGKSSFINAIMGKKVVSVSKTPGHTKHFQTIFITNNVRLCDCPGLVFPSLVPKTVQVLSGCYPIAQLRDPYTTIRFLSEHINIIKLLNIVHPDREDSWSALDICEAWAIKRGFFTNKGGRPDAYRAANNLLRMALDGSINIFFTPENFTEFKAQLDKNDPQLLSIRYLKGENASKTINLDNETDESSSESDEEEDGDDKPLEEENRFNILSVD